MMKIYGFEPSTWTNAARFTANAVGIDYELVQLDLAAGAGQQPDYLAIHPAGKVPAMDDDGFRLFESGAIQRYLAGKAHSSVYPTELKARAIVDQWSLFVSIHIGSAMGSVLFNRVIHQVVGAPSNPETLEESLGFLDRFLPIVDTELSKHAHLAADDLSIADLTLLAWLDPAELVDYDLSVFPSITAWRNRLKTEPLYTACHRDYKEMFEALNASGDR